MQITKFFSILIYFYLKCKGLLINTFFSYFFCGKKLSRLYRDLRSRIYRDLRSRLYRDLRQKSHRKTNTARFPAGSVIKP